MDLNRVALRSGERVMASFAVRDMTSRGARVMAFLAARDVPSLTAHDIILLFPFFWSKPFNVAHLKALNAQKMDIITCCV